MASVVVVPMALQAFSVSAFDKSKIQCVPPTQPDIARLNAAQSPIAHDLIDHIDTSNQTRFDPRINTRFVDVRVPAGGGATTGGQPITSREGVYLAWCMPQVFRAGLTVTESTSLTTEDRIKLGFKGKTPAARQAGEPDVQV